MSARYLNAPLLLLLWQVAPVRIQQDEVGRFRVAVGGGRGQYNFRDDPGYPPGVDCAGDSYPGKGPSTESDSYTSYGVSAEVRASNTLRLRAALGKITDYSGERHGTFGAVQAGYEQKNFGVGLGLASFGGVENLLQPSASARIGSLRGVSLRADYRHPEAGMGLIGGPRIGVAVSGSAKQSVRVFAGMATTPVPDSAPRAGGFVQVDVPLGFLNHRGGLSLNGFLAGVRRGNEDKAIYSLGLGAWLVP